MSCRYFCKNCRVPLEFGGTSNNNDAMCPTCKTEFNIVCIDGMFLLTAVGGVIDSATKQPFMLREERQ